jgi:hypothetical protein
MNVLCNIVTYANRSYELLPRRPLLVQKAIGAKTRPKESSRTRSDREHAVPVGVKIVGVAAGHVYAGITEFILSVDFGIPRVTSVRHGTAEIPTAPSAKAV